MTSSTTKLIATLIAGITLATIGADAGYAKNRGSGGGRSFGGKSMGRGSMNRNHGGGRTSFQRNSMNRMNHAVRHNQFNRHQFNRHQQNQFHRTGHSSNRSFANTGGRNLNQLRGGAMNHRGNRTRSVGNLNSNKHHVRGHVNKLGSSHRNVGQSGPNGRFRNDMKNINVGGKSPRGLNDVNGRFTGSIKRGLTHGGITRDKLRHPDGKGKRFDGKGKHLDFSGKQFDGRGNNGKNLDWHGKLDSVRGHVNNHLKDLGLKPHRRGHVSPIHQLIRNNHRRNNVCIDHRRWCRLKPRRCHWWYDWCAPIRYCEPVQHVTCSWNFVTTDHVVGNQVVVADARWYLGLNALLLPGQGLGIEEVTPNSPAAQVGLEPGMVITRCNGIDLVDEASMAQVIEQSGGVLQMELLLGEDKEPATCVVMMQRVPVQTF